MTTDVIFRKDKFGITAVFPHDIADHKGNMTCYAHIGQHGACCYGWYLSTKPAKPDEYKDLLRELVTIGYDDLRIMKRIVRK